MKKLKKRGSKTRLTVKRAIRKIRKSLKKTRAVIKRKRRGLTVRAFKVRHNLGTPTFVPRVVTAHYYSAGPRPGLRNVVVHTTAEPSPSVVLEPKAVFNHPIQAASAATIQRELNAVLDTEPGLIDQIIEDILPTKLAMTYANMVRMVGSNVERFMPKPKFSVEELKFLASERIPHSPFYWVTHKNKAMKPSKMPTEHLFYSLRMLFNHTVPPTFRVLATGEMFRRYDGVELDWSADYKKQAINEFVKVLNTRDDLDPNMKRQLRDMIANTKVITGLGL